MREALLIEYMTPQASIDANSKINQKNWRKAGKISQSFTAASGITMFCVRGDRSEASACDQIRKTCSGSANPFMLKRAERARSQLIGIIHCHDLKYRKRSRIVRESSPLFFSFATASKTRRNGNVHRCRRNDVTYNLNITPPIASEDCSPGETKKVLEHSG